MRPDRIEIIDGGDPTTVSLRLHTSPKLPAEFVTAVDFQITTQQALEFAQDLLHHAQQLLK